ncbi:MAG: nickel pincer cofactor biosynthesis protein LarC [Candidatus Korarchaeum sp.]|nr:nickel pincer cofactor biosynthesis protein LarC [Candidatus Korarchaeum sp.]
MILIDCSSGISGDMFLAALLDLGADEKKVLRAIDEIGELLSKIEVRIGEVKRRGIRAKKVDFYSESWPSLSGEDLINYVERCVEKLDISDEARGYAIRVAETLVEAERRVHGEAHLHEIGQPDAIAEIVGVSVALDDLKAFNTTVYSTPLAVGGGFVENSHGRLPVPAPVTLEILKGFPISGGPVREELATPTGASLLVNIVDSVTELYPMMRPSGVGYGAGSKELEIPNVIRIVSGEPLDARREEVLMIETNVDDVPGEVLGYALDKLMKEGARDAFIIPIIAKKGRPGQVLKAIADRGNAEHLARVMIEETGSLGVRVYRCERIVLNREVVPVKVSVDGREFEVRVKVAGSLRAKPEYEDVREIAERTGKPLRVVMKLVEDRLREYGGARGSNN